jgi:hypothetical protein
LMHHKNQVAHPILFIWQLINLLKHVLLARNWVASATCVLVLSPPRQSTSAAVGPVLPAGHPLATHHLRYMLQRLSAAERPQQARQA